MTPDALPDIFLNLGIALGLGLLVGLERESAESRLGGLRTFPLVTVLGVVCGMLVPGAGGWVVSACLISLAVLIAIGNYVLLRTGEERGGITTEVALVLMLLVGVLLTVAPRAVAVVIGGGTAVLLQAKTELRGIITRLGHDDLTAIMRFVLIALVVLPVLPNRPFGPFDVLNLYEIWLIVVLIVGISLAGYIVYRFFGNKAGVLLGGILGGVISSTATTVAYAKRTRNADAGSALAAVVVVIASTVVLIRLFIEIAVVAPGLLPVALPPLGIVFAVMAGLSLWLWWSRRRDESGLPAQDNPTEMKAAIFFGALYAVVLIAAAFAKQRFGTAGLYVVAGIAGLTDVDAITLSTAKLVAAEQLDHSRAWRVIAVANASNLLFKTAVVAILGSRKLLLIAGGCYAVAIGVSVLVVLFWPA